MIEDQVPRIDRTWARSPSMLDASRESLKEVMDGESGGAIECGKVGIDWRLSPRDRPLLRTTIGAKIDIIGKPISI